MEEPRIFDCVSGRLGRLHRIVDGIYRKHLTALRVSESQTMILLSLLEVGATPQIELARKLAFEKSSLSRNLVRLEKKGWVGKQGGYHPEILLTETGKKFARRLYPVWREAYEEASELMGGEGLTAIRAIEEKLI